MFTVSSNVIILIICRILDISYDQEAEYTITLEAFNVLGSELSSFTVQIETPIRDVVVNFIPALSASEPSVVHLQFQENFIKGNAIIDFNDGTIYQTFYFFNKSFPSANIEHRYLSLSF